jgi:hypothetical protein
MPGGEEITVNPSAAPAQSRGVAGRYFNDAVVDADTGAVDQLIAITREELHMSVMNNAAPIARPPLHATNQRSGETRQSDRSRAPRVLERRQILEGIEPLAVAPAFFGPPVIFLFGPWLLLVLLLIPPAAVLITLALAFVVVAGALAALVALLVSPYILVHHLHLRHSASRRRLGVVPAPAVGGSSPRASFASSASGHHLAASG